MDLLFKNNEDKRFMAFLQMIDFRISVKSTGK